MSYHVQCGGFEGPLDLLVSLVYRGQIDLQSVSLRTLSEDYLERARRSPDLDEATEVLVHLAVLADLKARTLVPHAPAAETPPPDESPASDLSERLGAQMAEYLKFRAAAQALRVLEEIQSRIFARPQGASDPHGEALLEGLTLQDLFVAFAQVLRRTQDTPQEIAGEEFTVQEKMEAAVAMLRAAGGSAPFVALFRAEASRLEIIVTFLALLELVRQRRLRARQPQTFGEIEMVLVEEP